MISAACAGLTNLVAEAGEGRARWRYAQAALPVPADMDEEIAACARSAVRVERSTILRNRLQAAPMSDIPACPKCAMENTYPDGANYVCADCGHEFPIVAPAHPGDAAVVVRDVNGNVLSSGDTVTVIKDLKVKGSSIPLKQGTVIRNIRLVEGDDEHIEGNSEKIKGLVLKVCFLKKA
jgi:protein PhnA